MIACSNAGQEDQQGLLDPFVGSTFTSAGDAAGAPHFSRLGVRVKVAVAPLKTRRRVA
jgi:hypothetical protein